MRQSKKYISEIISDGIRYEGLKEIMTGIRNFYRILYEKLVEEDNSLSEDEQFYKECPKLSNDQKAEVDKPLTIEDLTTALKSCKESSPGPDGITYAAYKAVWDMAAPVILEAWHYSVETGQLPLSHLESAITLLPKEGKDTRDIKNWRPISLANCDSKIITKALAIKVSKVLESLIDKSQTAYVPGRNVMDNIRTNFMIKSHCNNNKINALLVSLDAKKAFDSVSHNYISKTLEAYGFGKHFILSFKTLYNNLSASILVNGYKTEKICINRGVKQGDALSCALFILCIDPLIRNINLNRKIKGVEIISRITKKKFEYKITGYADDIAITIRNDPTSIQQVFHEYERLTKRSGLELNADKTEILNLVQPENRKKTKINFSYMEQDFCVETVNSLKICGLIYSNISNDEYLCNVNTKIDKMESQLKKWMVRNLTFEGKILIVKTFGLSQLIYNMQCYDFKEKDLIRIERLIFKFIWSKDWENKKHIERIKRSVLKNEYNKGGMKAPDIECLNRALKLKQFLRSSNSDHPIRHLQSSTLQKIGYKNDIQQEYARLALEDSIIKASQDTINKLTDFCREKSYGGMEKAIASRHAINLAASIRITEHLDRKNHKLLSCLYNPLKNEHIHTLNDLLVEREITRSKKHIEIINNVLKIIDHKITEVASQFNENLNENDSEDLFFLDDQYELKNANEFSVKDFQIILKNVLCKVESLNVSEKNKLCNYTFEEEHFVRFRKQCKNTKLRSIFHRLLNNDFFFAERMYKYKMSETPNCQRCGMIEGHKHLLFECKTSRDMWAVYNQKMDKLIKNFERIDSYEKIFDFKGGSMENIVKIKLIQETIQIKRPTYWSNEKMEIIIQDQITLNSKIKSRNNHLQIK
jgi:hypothetical protein